MMRQRGFKTGCMLLVLMMFFCQFEQLEAKERSPKSERTLKQEWAEPSSKYFYQPASVQKGRFYSIKDFINVAGTSVSAAQLRSKIIKKKVKFTMSGSGLVIRNQSFKANKTGDYKLNVKTEDEWHVFSLHVVDQYFEIQADEVSKVTISQKEMGETTTMEFTDSNIVNEISGKLSQSKYTFVFPKTPKIPVGFGGYYVSLYNAEGSCINHLAVVSDSIWDTEVYMGKRFLWKSDSHFAKECFEFIDKTYKGALSLIPERVW